MGRGCGVGVKILKIKCTYSFFWVFLRFYCFLFIFLLFISLLLWDENPNGTSVPYVLFKYKNVKLKFGKDEEKIVKIFPQLRGCFWIEEAKEVRLRFSDPLKKRRRFGNGQGEKSYKEEKRKD